VTKEPDPLGDDALDFWLGDWDVSWVGRTGRRGSGRNRITRVVDGRGVLEQFDGRVPGGQLLGMSLSIRDNEDGRWRQTWIDSSGGYLDFVGVAADGRIAFQRPTVEDGVPTLRRMVWTDVEPDRFAWRWQRSTDQGATWTDEWVIDYRRRRSRAATTRAGAAPGTRRSAR